MSRICTVLLRIILITVFLGSGSGVLVSAAFANTALLTHQGQCSQDTGTERDLEVFLFANYSSRSRPRRSPQDVVVVTFRLTLAGIKHVYEIEQRIEISGFVSMNWQDHYLQWQDEHKFSCIGFLLLPAKKVWIPDVVLAGAENKYGIFTSDGENVRLYIDGNIDFRPGGIMATSCDSDLTFYPYDEQTCIYSFQSWLYVQNYMRLTLQPGSILTWQFEENDDWAYISTKNRTKTVFYSNPLHAYDAVEFAITIRRKVGFYIVNVIIPAIIIAVVEVATFALPSHEPIKIHVSFTSLLAYTVYLQIIVPQMPKTSDYPLMSVYLVLKMAYIAFALIGQGLVFVLLDRSDANRDPNLRVFNVFRNFLGPFLGVTMRDDVDDEVSKKEIDSRHLEIKTYITIGEYPKLHAAKSFEPDKMAALLSPALIQHKPENFKSVEEEDDQKVDEMVSNKSKIYYTQTTRSLTKRERGVIGTNGTDPLRRARWNYIVRVIDRYILITYFCLVILTPVFMFFIKHANRSEESNA